MVHAKKEVTVAVELTPQQIAVLAELADQVTAGRAVVKWFKALTASAVAIVTLGYMVLQILTVLGWRH